MLQETKRKYLNKSNQKVFDLPNLIEVQLNSYNWFLSKGLKELFSEISPILDFTEKALELNFLDFSFDDPKYDEVEANSRNATFEAALRVKVQLTNKQTGEIKEQEVYLGEFPLMTERGTFIINGVERVVVSQIIRSPGVFFTLNIAKGEKHFGAKVIPNRGAWLEFETDANGVNNKFISINRARLSGIIESQYMDAYIDNVLSTLGIDQTFIKQV